MSPQTLIEIELPLDADHFTAEMISAKCDADGIKHELMPASSLNPYGTLEGDPHRILVGEADVVAVRRIVADLDTSAPTPSRHSRPQRVVALSLGVMLLGPVVVAAVDRLLGIFW